MPLKLLPHKSWHVYNQENVARVKRDEARAAEQLRLDDDRAFAAEAEARLDRLRNKKKRTRTADDHGHGHAAEKELERQLKGKTRRDDETGDLPSHANAVIVRPEGWTPHGAGRGRTAASADAPMTTNGHLNFWAELEAGAQPPAASVLEKRLNKVLANEPAAAADDSLTKVYLAKKGEGEPKGWYASPDGKSERERKEPVETTLERTYRDNESKKLDDPLALMNSYLKRRDDVKSGKPFLNAPTRRQPSSRDRYLEPIVRDRRWHDNVDDEDEEDDTSRSRGRGSGSHASDAGEFEPVLPRLLPPKNHRRPPRASSSSSATPHDSSSREQDSSSTTATSSAAYAGRGARPPPPLDPTQEAERRVGSERTRAAALLLAARKRRDFGSPARSEAESLTAAGGGGGWGMYNREEVLAARNHHHRGVGGGGGGTSVVRPAAFGSDAAATRGGGGWGERKERRHDRERFASGRQPRRDDR
ncbi:hypothetical protein JCM3774_000685 [Rhodotorula dairenensis]